jgi:hypothetical protein
VSQRKSGHARQEADHYPTPAWVTEAIIPHLPIEPWSLVWEPAVGAGQMATVLAARLPAIVVGSDIRDGNDFLKLPAPPGCTAIVTNPPYNQATEFVDRALRLMEPVGGTVAMLLRSDFAHAKTRQYLFRDCPAFQKKVELLKRITWFQQPPGAKGKSPSENHAWFIWNWKNEAAPTLGFAP